MRRYYAELYLSDVDYDDVRLLSADISDAAQVDQVVVFLLARDGGYDEDDVESLSGVKAFDDSEFAVIVHRSVGVLVAPASERTVEAVRDALEG